MTLSPALSPGRDASGRGGDWTFSKRCSMQRYHTYAVRVTLTVGKASTSPGYANQHLLQLDPADCKPERPRLYSVVHSAARQENISQMGKSWAHSSAYPRLESLELSVHGGHTEKMSRWCAANTKLV